VRGISRRVVGAGLVPALAPQGRNLNSLGFQPQVGVRSTRQTPEGWPIGPRSATPPGFGIFGVAPHLGLKPQANQIPPLRGEGGDEPRPYENRRPVREISA
jgi:hypothetical protein